MRRFLMARLRRTGWAKLIALAVIGVVAVGTVAVAGVGFPLFPEPLPGAKGPGQRWGSAEGRDHLVADGTNRTTGQSLRAKYPLRAPSVRKPDEGRNTASVATPPAPAEAVTGFDRATSKEIVSERAAHSRTYANADGTETTELSTTPLHYRDGAGAWRPVDPALVASDGGWAGAAGSVGVRLADRADADRLAAVTFPSGESFAYGLDGAAAAKGAATPENGDEDGNGNGNGNEDGAADSRVSYREVLPETDLWLDSRAGGVKETLVLRSTDAPTTFDFPLALTGLTAKPGTAGSGGEGSVVLADDQGRTKAVIPAGFMEDANGAVSHAVRYELIARDGGQALRVSADRDWLTDPARAFPVRVDPSVDTTASSRSMYVTENGAVAGSNELHVGKGAAGSTASYLGFPGLDTELKNHKIFGAQLQVVNFDAPSCKPRSVSVHPVTQSWTVATGGSYPGPSVGGSLASKSFAYGHIAVGSSKSGCPAAGELFDLGKGGRDLVQRWVDGSQPNYGLSLRASATDPLGFKKFTGDTTANPPKLFVTHSPYNASYSFPKPVPDPPVLQNQAGKVKVTVTNKGAETWTAGGYYLAYRAYDSKGKLVTQQRAADVTGQVAHGGRITFDATIKALPPGTYMLDFTMVRTGGKVFTDEQVPPGRLVLQVFDIAPVVKEQFPPNGYQAQTLTPQLWAAGVDIDAPPGSTLQYKFEICEADKDGKPTGCTTSAYQSGSAYTVPAGRLKWGTTYLWRGFVKDASNEVPTAQVALVAAVPQPEITSRLAEAQGKEFDPNVGNFTTAAIDASVAGVGPDLTLVRTYNSLDPRRDAAFGAGWSTRYDMRLTPDDDGTGNVVIRYPDGQDVRFGKNADGTFAPPPGRFAKLTADAAAGTYKLQDKSGTVYDFSSSGLLVKVTDPFSTVVNYTYSGGKISTAVNARTGRSLTFTWTGAHVTKVATNAVNGAALTWSYTYTGDRLDSVCDPAAGCTRYGYGAGSHYRSTVLDSRPESYWRLGEAEGTAANSAVEVNLGKDRGTYTDVTLGVDGGITGDPGTAATFNGTTSRVDLPSGTLKKSRDAAVEVWFKTIASGVGGPLVGYQNKAWGTAPTSGAPLLYVGTDGKLRGQFWTGTAAPITDITKNVNDGKWHHAVLSVSGSTQNLYLDGKLSGTLTGAQLTQNDLTYNQIGAARPVTPASWPGWGATAAKSFAGTIDDVSVYHHPLGAAAVAGHYREGGRAADLLTSTTLPSGRTAAEVRYDTSRDRVEEYTDRNGGTWKVGTPAVFGNDKDLRRTVEVRDPMDAPYFYEYDGLTSRMLRYGEPMALGAREPAIPSSPGPTEPPAEICTKPDPGDPAFCTNPPGDGGSEPDFIRHPADGVAIRTFGYDDKGFQTAITSENGDTVALGYDDRGNVVRRTTCRAKDNCQTTYTTYPVPTGDFDLRADQPSETRDGRSTGVTDNRYRTQYQYNDKGALLTQTAPDGGVVRHTYTTGAEPAVDGGNTATGLPLTTTDPLGKVTRYRYFKSGDLAQLTEPSGQITKYTYDALGRKLTETTVSDAQPAGVTTTFTYDKLSRVATVTDPAATNVVNNGAKHQQKTTTSYDADGNVTGTEVSDLLGGDATRVMTFALDDRGRPETVTDAEGSETAYTYDVFGNKTSMVDANGNHFDYLYTARNMMAETRLRDWEDDGGDDDYTVLESFAYDMGGRVARNTDSMGRTIVYEYFGDDLVKSITLKDFHNPDGSKRDIVIEANTYDGAGNVLTETAGNGKLVTQYTYDEVGRTKSTVSDPSGVARRTTLTYDLAGNVKTSASSGLASNVPWPVSVNAETVTYKYDDAGNAIEETVQNGAESRTTLYGYDQRGLTTSRTDPGGRTTEYTYDELGRPQSSKAPEVRTESGGGAPVTTRPVTYTGYDTFGAATESVDALGRVNRSTYDRLGRVVSTTAPAYTAPGAGTPVTPTVTQSYDALGNVTESTDPLGRVTRYEYDRQNRLLVRDEPTGSGTGDDRARWSYTYTRTGEVLSVTDPNGARAETTYDDMDRPVTTTQIERSPQPGSFTTRNDYDDAGNVVKQTAPSGAATLFVYDALGQLTRLTDAAGVVTQFGYDIAGREVRRTDGKGRTSSRLYDGLGQLVRDADLDSTNSELRKVGYGYDLAGNLISATDSLGRSTTYAYDALDRLTSQTEPVSDTKTITTSFGYDALGNRTRYTDGRGNSTVYTVNTLGLPESVIEPSTARDPSAADRTWTTAYDATGQAVKVTAPGGVTREREFDKAGNLIRESGAGAEAATAEKRYGYDAAGRLTKASSPKGDNGYEYNDRGLLLKAEGPSGDASYSYNGDGQLTERTDAAGTATFTYARQQLAGAKDPLTGVQQSYDYDGAGAVERVDYGAGQSRAYTYDNLGRLDTDTVKSSGGAAVASTDYDYDTNDQLTGKTTTGTAKAGKNTYGYDQAGRLTSWTADGATTEYGWDDSGNRVKNGAKTATFDERNRLLSDGDYTYDYTARGTLASRTSSGLAEEFTFDAFDRMTKAGESGTAYTYDGLDRVAARNGVDFTYAGLAPDPVKDNSATYGRGAADELLSVAEGGAAQLSVTDKHGDVVGGMSPTNGAGTSLASSTAYDPFGATIGTAGASDQAGSAGFQGDYTDPETDQVNMGARWYDPGTGTFDSRDAYTYASGASILANRYTYGAGSPTNFTDPDGNWPSCGWCKKTWNKVKNSKAGKFVAKSAKTVWNAAVYTVRHPLSALRIAKNALGNAAKWVYEKSGLKTAVNAVVNATKWVGSKISAVASSTADWTRQKAAEARAQVQAAREAVTRKAKSVAAFVAKHNPIPDIVAAAKPLMAVAAAIVTANPNLPAIIVSATRDVIADVAKVTNAIRDAAVEQIGIVVESVSAAVDYAIEIAPAVWEGVKTVGNVVGEVTGFNDIKNCVTKGDMEACAWAVATVGGLALGGVGAGAVRAAKAGRMGMKAVKYADDIAKAADKIGRVEDAADRVQTAVSCAQLAADVVGNSFLPGTDVVMADGTGKPIEDVEAGDKVKATDPTTGKTSAQEVTATIEGKGLKNLVKLTVDTDGAKGDATDTITATEGHLLYLPDLKKWQKAGELKPGQWLRSGSGSWVQIEAVQAWTQQAAVYNLTVDAAHTYYVAAGATPVLVHNCTDLADATDLDLSVAALRPIPPKKGKAFQYEYDMTEAGRALQKHTDPVKRTAGHVAKYLPFLHGANRLTNKGALNRGGQELLSELLGNPAATRTISPSTAHYGGSVLDVLDSATGRGARWSRRGGGIQFEGWL
ncbi:LamG-like jellyroll fold domain-containing protein [Streptomyces sp. NPDC059863]|uniref:LamG-like jellyroll fold domain-containing protein n=1 Tax=unclassified Streptomyces TaxID=2593676 RepID=UPI0036519D83